MRLRKREKRTGGRISRETTASNRHLEDDAFGWLGVDRDVVHTSTIRAWFKILYYLTLKTNRRRRVRFVYRVDRFLRASTTRSEPLLRNNGARSIGLSTIREGQRPVPKSRHCNSVPEHGA
jgi:hypothetical protein